VASYGCASLDEAMPLTELTVSANRPYVQEQATAVRRAGVTASLL
jgi:hypothetical protein